jgi:hypothetical protein
MQIIFFFFLFCLSHVYGQEQVDSVVTIKRSSFFTDILSKKGGAHCFQGSNSDQYIRYNSPYLKAMPIEFLSTSTGLFLHFGRSGKLYLMEDRGDSLLYFVRQDRTINYNYNIGSILFNSKRDIYEFGGYGFWKSNGLLRQYNFSDREWDIVPVNLEVSVPLVSVSKMGAWVDTSGDYMYVPYQITINDGLSSVDNGIKIDPTSYRLNVKQRKWEKLGVISDEALGLLKTSNWTGYASERGLFLGFTKGLYYLDFVSNQILFYNDPNLVQSLLRMQSNMLSYYYGGRIYHLNPVTNKYDSLRFDPSLFKPTGSAIWVKPVSYRAWAGTLSLLLLLGLGLLYRRRKKREQPIAPFSTITGLAGTFRPFTETEQSLLQLLLSRSDKGLTASITDINYVLGVKDKSPGMQKKVRSDVMNNLNEKYAFVTHQKESLVQSIRSESDKRYFEYLINPACRETLRQLLT